MAGWDNSKGQLLRVRRDSFMSPGSKLTAGEEGSQGEGAGRGAAALRGPAAPLAGGGGRQAEPSGRDAAAGGRGWRALAPVSAPFLVPRLSCAAGSGEAAAGAWRTKDGRMALLAGRVLWAP